MATEATQSRAEHLSPSDSEATTSIQAIEPSPSGGGALGWSLPLNAFERYMLTDDRPTHPMTFTIRLLFSGGFDEVVFRQAVRAATSLHPLLRSHVTGGARLGSHWHATATEAYVDIADASVPMEFPGREQIDLAIETPLRIWVRHRNDGAEMRLQFHHAAADGVGAYRFVEDLLCCYERAACPESRFGVPRPIDAAQLAHRNAFGLSRWQQFLRLPLELWGLIVGMALFFLIRPGQSQSPRQPKETARERLRLLDYPAHTFSVAVGKSLMQTAKQAGATLNDLLVRDMFVALEQWNLRWDGRAARQPIRVMIPMDLRGASDATLPATNVVAMINLDRHPWWNRRPRWLLWTVSAEMRLLKRCRFALSFIRAIAILQRLPNGLATFCDTRQCRATSVMSNLGRVLEQSPLERVEGKLRAGGLFLDRVESAPPVRPRTATSFSALSYAGRLTVIMNYDRGHLDRDAARELFGLIVGQLERSAAQSLATPATGPSPAIA